MGLPKKEAGMLFLMLCKKSSIPRLLRVCPPEIFYGSLDLWICDCITDITGIFLFKLYRMEYFYLWEFVYLID